MARTLKETVYYASNFLNQETDCTTRDRPFESSTEGRKTSIKDENNNENIQIREKTFSSNQDCLKTLGFKYTLNAPLEDIENVRELLARQQGHQNFRRDEWEFFKTDYDRMMKDDWLVTRFLLRGRKGNHSSASHGFVDSRTAQSCYAKTIELIKACARFRYEYRINALTEEKDFPTEWTKVRGMFHYRHDLVGNPVAYMRVGLHRPKLIEEEALRHEFKRYMLYVLEQCDKELFQRPGKALCCVFDMSNVAFENIDLELTTWMIKSFKNCAPKLLCYVIIYNPPWFFTATFKIIRKTLLSNNKRQSIKFAYGDEILNFIEYINLPPYLRETLS